MLYLVPTPIGNMDDLTYRAVDVLKSVDLILAEDTRTSRKLLDRYQIDTPLAPFHAFNEHRALEKYTEELLGGKSIALISDAGTPGISDPGFLLVRACYDKGIELTVLPGPTAFVPALVLSGIPASHFFFEGFLPHKKGRKTRLEWLSELPDTFVLYESPHRLIKCLQELSNVAGPDRMASVVREISKKFETAHRGSLEDLIQHFSTHAPKGEIVIVVAGRRTKV
jgi:16S rRNA (cytidine1402-2'-O)-methyltransferase